MVRPAFSLLALRKGFEEGSDDVPPAEELPPPKGFEDELEPNKLDPPPPPPMETAKRVLLVKFTCLFLLNLFSLSIQKSYPKLKNLASPLVGKVNKKIGETKAWLSRDDTFTYFRLFLDIFFT